MTIGAEERELILASIDRLVQEKIAPKASEIDESNRFPSDLYAAAAELGLLGLWVPEEYGGTGPDLMTPLLISERIARASASFSLVFSNCGDATTPIVHAAAEHLKREWLPRIVSGEVIPCFSLSEPGAGSDAAAIATRAERHGDEYLINGRKCWCTNGSVGGVFVLFAKTDPKARHKGVSAFLVPRDIPGLCIGRDEDLIGLRGSPTTELTFEDARLPADHLLGEEGEGFRIAMITLDEARLNCAAMAVGAATGATEYALDYARDRVQFDKPIIEHQGLAFLLAEMTAELAAARALWEQAIDKLAEGPSREASTYAAMAKLICTRTAMRIAVEAVQVLGGYGLSKAHPVERVMRDVKALEIFDGTSQIQKMLIGRHLQKEGMPF